MAFPKVSPMNIVCVCGVYPHGGPSHAGMDGQGALACGADALHNDTENGPTALLGLANQAVIQIHFPEKEICHLVVYF